MYAIGINIGEASAEKNQRVRIMYAFTYILQNRVQNRGELIRN